MTRPTRSRPLGELLDDADRRADLGRRARTRVEERFALEPVGARSALPRRPGRAVTRIAYIVSAYKLPAQLERLLRRLQAARASRSRCTSIRKTRGAHVWDEMVARGRDLDVTWLPAPPSQWGGFGHVRATLKGIDHSSRTGATSTTRCC